MTDPATPDRSSQWNAGAWFGSQLGGTLWLLISAGVLAPRSAPLAALVFALFLLPNLVGAWLWRARRRVGMFAALQILTVADWACAMAAIYVIDRAGHWRTLAIGGENNVPASAAYVMLTALVAALLVMFRLRQRALERDHAAPPGPSGR